MGTVGDGTRTRWLRLWGRSNQQAAPRSDTRLRLDGHALSAGEALRPLPSGASPDEVLAHYLDFIRDLRGASNLDHLPLRDEDVDALAMALGDTSAQIERRLVELIDCTRSEARRIRKALFQRRLAVPAAGFVLGMGGFGSAAAMKLADERPPVVREESETTGSIELDVSPPADAPVVAPAPPPQVQDTNRAGEPITRTGSGGDWAEVIEPVVITPDDAPASEGS